MVLDCFAFGSQGRLVFARRGAEAIQTSMDGIDVAREDLP
jgi:hypothetical protein